MKETVTNGLEQFLAASNLTRDQLFWSVLVAGLLFASLHLITMLVTRWGDRRATSKSLICSILVHVSCALGLVVVYPPPDTSADIPEPESPVPVQRVFVEGEEKVVTETPGNTPVWEKLPEPISEQLTRTERLPPELVPLQSPERTDQPITPPEVSVPDLPSFPKESVVTPRPQSQGTEGLRVESSVPLEINEPTAESRPEVEIPSSSNSRKRLARTGLTDTEVTRATNRGAVDRVEADFDPSQHLASLDMAAEPDAFLKRAAEEPIIQRRTGPVPSTLPDPQPGTMAPEESEGASGGSPVPPRISRLRSRTPQSVEDGTVERFRPERTPQIADWPGDRALAVRNSVPVDFPREGLTPNAHRPNFEADPSKNVTSLPSTYRLRSLERRKESARQFGGTDASERAVESSLRWFVLHQSPEGFWDADRFGAGQVKFDENGVNRREAGKHGDVGLTALAVLSFLGAGYTHEEGQYAVQVEKALRWLVKQQRHNGYLGARATHYAKMYCHAMATYALAEAFGMQSDPTIDTGLRAPIERAIGYILDHQNPKDGGWRYLKGQKSDMSMFGWQLMALKSAEITGVDIPDRTKYLMVQFLKERSLGDNHGLAGYRIHLPESPSMTAEALFCKQMLGIKRSNSASLEAVDYLMERLPKRSETDLYYWYYGTLAMYQYGGKPWQEWNEMLRDQLVSTQQKTGDHAGSWNPNGPWGRYGGRVYSTALATLCLEVYYRFLPLYQMGGRYDDQ